MFRLFRVSGFDVLLHWSWLLVAMFELRARNDVYQNQIWNIAEYLSLFGIVLLHEFGHAFACRSVGGRVERIVLWPLGGVAHVAPPPRPGALLWSIVAGPLVNVALAPVLFVMSGFVDGDSTDVGKFVVALSITNLGLLIFNLLPIYPLDGGKIVQALLWFVIGPVRALSVVTVIGLFGAAGGLALAISQGSVWIGVLAAYAGWNSWSAFQVARHAARMKDLPRRVEAQCPTCKTSPVIGDYGHCACGLLRDPFDGTACTACKREIDVVLCGDCQQVHPVGEWFAHRQAG